MRPGNRAPPVEPSAAEAAILKRIRRAQAVRPLAPTQPPTASVRFAELYRDNL
jgi:hypothetical protein